MAKNWTVAEATEAILNGDKEAVLDIGKRFPLAVRAIAIAGDKAKDILAAFNFVTVRKVESVLKDGVEISEDPDEGIEDPTEEKEKKPVKKEKETKAEKSTGKRGRSAKKKEEEAAMNEPEEDAEEEEEDYSSMSEVELFKICKKKGLKPAPKQTKQYYLDLLNPAEDADDEDDWDEEEEEEKPVKKTTKKAPAKKSKKAAEDEDDDWDI